MSRIIRRVALCGKIVVAKLLNQNFYVMSGKDHPHVKNDDKYEALRDKGMSKERAAKISNSKGSSKRGGEHSHRGKGK
jgi:hypothetical protein